MQLKDNMNRNLIQFLALTVSDTTITTPVLKRFVLNRHILAKHLSLNSSQRRPRPRGKYYQNVNKIKVS